MFNPDPLKHVPAAFTSPPILPSSSGLKKLPLSQAAFGVRALAYNWRYVK